MVVLAYGGMPELINSKSTFLFLICTHTSYNARFLKFLDLFFCGIGGFEMKYFQYIKINKRL